MTATATLALRTETTGVRPQFDHARVHDRRALMTDPDALTPRARQVNERPIRRYTLFWERATAGQRFLLRQAWKDARGPVMPMAYTPVGKTDSDAHDVRFVDKTLAIRRTSAGEWTMSAEVEEAL